MQNNPGAKKTLRSLFLGGILPVIAFSIIEDRYGVIWGLVSGMIFGVGEIAWEWRTQGKVEALTWAGNGMILVLGAVSLVTQEGIWFKLQPALIEVVMAVALWGSVLLGKPLLWTMSQKQLSGNPALENPVFLEFFRRRLAGVTFRLGFFFAFHAALATWAALHWSTAAWAALKGIGFTVSTLVYLLAESLLLRYRIQAK